MHHILQQHESDAVEHSVVPSSRRLVHQIDGALATPLRCVGSLEDLNQRRKRLFTVRVAQHCERRLRLFGWFLRRRLQKRVDALTDAGVQLLLLRRSTVVVLHERGRAGP